MAIITKSDEKFRSVAQSMSKGFTDDEFVNKFVEMYPDDWRKVERRYARHERKTKKGSHPMPNPKQYVKNVSHKIRAEIREEHKQEDNN